MAEPPAWPQPYEGINGTVRTSDHLLSLEEEDIAVRRLIADMTGVLMSTTGVGSPAPMVERISERMRNPQPGDLVLETSTRYRRSEDWYRAFGILLGHRKEWETTDMTDHAWYVQYGPGERDICRWVDCEFVAVPTDEPDRPPLGTHDGSGVTVTRDDLLGALADSGFALRDPRTNADA